MPKTNVTAVPTITLQPGDTNIPVTTISGTFTSIGVTVDRPNPGVTVAVALDVSLDGGTTWRTGARATWDSTVPTNWPGKDLGAPMPSNGFTLGFDDANGPVTMVNPKVRGVVTVNGGTYTTSVNVVGS